VDLRALQVFSTVLRRLNFSRAADELHMSVSAVSRTIARLEDELGAPLFDRDRRGMRPTAAARELSAVALRMQADWRALQGRLGSASALSGELRIFCSVAATHTLLSPLLAAYRAACPGVDVLLHTGDQADGVERVRKGEADVAVIARPSLLPEALAYRHVSASPLYLCLPQVPCPVQVRLAADDVDPPDMLPADLPWILPERGVSKDAIEAWLLERYGVLPPVYARVAGHEAIVAMVSLGLGVGVVPQLVIEASGLSRSLEVHSLAARVPPIDIGLCARAGRLADPVVAALWGAVTDGQ
jgi:LysR family positive regulator for ilvC